MPLAEETELKQVAFLGNKNPWLIKFCGDVLGQMRKRKGAPEVQHGHSSVARFLIDVGAKVDVPDLQGITPLSCAAQLADTEMMYMLNADLQLALERLKEDQGDVGLDVALCSAAVSACRSPGSWPQAHQLLTETRQLRVVPNCATYSGAIASSARSARGELNRCDAWAAGLGMLRAAFGAALRVNSICFGSAINGAPWPSGFQLLSVLQQCGLQGGAVTGNAAVTWQVGLCWQQGLDLAESMIHRRLCSEITFNAAISAIAAGAHPIGGWDRRWFWVVLPSPTENATVSCTKFHQQRTMPPNWLTRRYKRESLWTLSPWVQQSMPCVPPGVLHRLCCGICRAGTWKRMPSWRAPSSQESPLGPPKTLIAHQLALDLAR
ncbi:Hypothetical protein SCF082_LOCUS35592 [Durusdinium trenchii]|uniref:Uncharacterized protein n=1 Tax=Durusdinium trenchii TaxID=1381693 RepID=A0ABP0PA10_9DINO